MCSSDLIEVAEGVRIHDAARGEAEVLRVPGLHAVSTVATLFGGRAHALVARVLSEQLLLVVRADRTLAQRIVLPAATRAVAFAEERGLAIALADERAVRIIDLRTGELAGAWEAPQPLVAVAIDAGARRVAYASIDDGDLAQIGRAHV